MKKKNDQIDQIIKNKLNQLRVEYDPSLWDMFEQKLDASEAGTPEAEDRWLDEVVFEKLHKLEGGNIVSRWDLMAAKLDEDARERRKSLRTRLMEAVLVMLILFTFVQYFGDQTPERLFNNLPFAFNASNNRSSDLEQTAPIAGTTEGNSVKQKIAFSENPDAFASAAKASVGDSKAATNLMNPSQKYKPSPALPLSPTKPQQSLDNSEHITNPLNAQPALDIPAPAEREELMAALDRIMLDELSANEEKDYPKLVKPVKPKSGMYVSMFGSMDYNRIITPAALNEAGELIDEAFERYELGYSGGIMLSWEKGRWELGTGAIYTAKEYEPRPLVYLGGSFFDGYYGESFKLVELNILQLPLQVRYNFIKENKWRAYVTTSLSLQVALQANYYLGEERSVVGQPTRPPIPVPNTPAEEKAKILSKGLFEGGTLLQNGYVTGNIGFGVEYFINERCGLFTQPTYHHSLDYFTKGFGPDADRINTMSIFTGVRVKL